MRYAQFYREERNWHADTLLQTNARVSLGAAAVLVTGVLGAAELRGLGQREPFWTMLALVCVVLGAILFAWSLVMHWNFRIRKMRECERVVCHSLDPANPCDALPPIFADSEKPDKRRKDDLQAESVFAPSPSVPAFGFIIGSGLGLIGLGILIFFVVILFR